MKSSPSSKKLTFHISGMHCGACELFVERKLKKAPGVTSVKARLDTNTVLVEGNFSKPAADVAKELTVLVKPEGYELTTEKSQKRQQIRWGEFAYAVPVAVVVIGLFIALQKTGIINLYSPEELTFPAIVMIGIVASLSSCMAVVGGLVLSMSANIAKEAKTERLKSQVFFHGSRVVSFFFFGGVIGLIGSAFTLSAAVIVAMSLTVGVVMVLLGLNLLDVFSFTNKLLPKMPKVFAHKLLNAEQVKGKFAPLFLGAVTFFLPCGFTQSMQIEALRSGNFFGGAFTMLAFALGTLPVLSLISVTSVNFSTSAKAGVFFKTAGLIVLSFALLNILNAFVVLGWVKPFVNF
ncbi:MAG: sulfite exporter TauE/SafE family protein [bacterium]